MYVKINGTNYTKLASLTFAPETSLLSDSLPINQFVADIITSDDIQISQWAELYNDGPRDEIYRLCAKYWITEADRINPETVRVVAESELKMMDREKLSAVMLNNALVSNVIRGLFPWRTNGDMSYMIGSGLIGQRLTGYCPEQTPRERLMLICLKLGAYVQSYGRQYTLIDLLPTDAKLIPIYHTFWRPEWKYEDWVTKTIIRDHTYEIGDPNVGEDYVKVNDVTYLDSWIEMEYLNPDAPQGTPPNEVTIENMTLNNALSIGPKINAYYFRRGHIEMDVLNNERRYWPGDKVIFYLDEQTLMTGYIEKCVFSYGLQSRAHLSIAMVEEVTDTVTLTVNYQYDGVTVAHRETVVPTNISYTYYNPREFYRVEGDRLKRYKPSAAGVPRYATIEESDVTKTENCLRYDLPLT